MLSLHRSCTLTVLTLFCAGCASNLGARQYPEFSTDVGAAGCEAFGPLNRQQIEARARQWATWPNAGIDALISAQEPNASVYFFQCLEVVSRIAVGNVFFGLVRDHAITKRAGELIVD